MQRSNFSELAHKRTVAAIKENNKTTEASNISSIADISDNEQKQVHSSVVKDKNVYNGIVKEENALAEAVKEEKSHSDMVKTERSFVLPEKKSITDSKPISQKTAKKDSKRQKKNSEKVIVFYGGNAAANAVESEIDNSDDKGLKTLKSGTMATITVGEILKPEKITKGVRRRKKFNKDKTAQNIKNLGIKAEFRNQMKDTFLQANNSSKKALNTGGKAILKSIRSEISEIGEDNLAFKAVDDAISTVETAVSIEKGTVAVVNSGITAAKAIKNTSVAIVKAPKNISSAAKVFSRNIKKMQKVMRMKNAHKLKLARKTFQNGVRYVAQVIISTAKSAAIKIFASFFVIIILIIAIIGGVIAAVCSFLWQTPTDLDTTQMVKLIAELDYNRQKAYFDKGITAVELEKKNDNEKGKYYGCIYKLAVNVPAENEEIIVGDQLASEGAVAICKVTVNRMDGSGKSLKPTYSGFNKTFNSSDEMLEEYRWTTDDYMNALAYLQVKNENLGWFENLFGWAGEYKLKTSLETLHKATYEQNIVVVDDNYGEDKKSYSFTNSIFTTSYYGDDETIKYIFGRKYSVDYLIQNDMIRFDDDDLKNKMEKERYEYIRKYGNFGVANLNFPLALEDDELISDRISKHFGKQLILEYEPPEPPSDSHDRVYGKVTAKAGYHYANDLRAYDGDEIYAPISGLCKVNQRDERGFEFVISTAYNGNTFDFTKEGYLVKISCASTTFIPSDTPTQVSKGRLLGKVAGNVSANYKIPDSENDTDNEDIFADKLFPCCTDTAYSSISDNEYDIPKPNEDHLHIELYKLPCDFTDKGVIEKNMLAPELFFDYSKEVD
ncbi:MAG: hypothetical protein IJ583_17855 [Firmicutes bacterium]|nr:hypothetical protein [Bacillota bacterium]